VTSGKRLKTLNATEDRRIQVSISAPCEILATRSRFCHQRASSTRRSPRYSRHVTRPSTAAPASTGARLRRSPLQHSSMRVTTLESRDRTLREALSHIATPTCGSRTEMATMCPSTLLLRRTAQGRSSPLTPIFPSTPSLVTNSDMLRPIHQLSSFGRLSLEILQTVLRS